MSENVFDYAASVQGEMLSPEEIENRDFSMSRRGFDQMEVQAFLRRLAVSYRSALTEKRSALVSLDKVQHAFAETIRHSDAEIAELRRERDHAVGELEDARTAAREAMRQRDEMEKALRELRESSSVPSNPAPILPVIEEPVTREDPYDIAGEQVKALLRAADDTATQLRKDSEAALASAREESEQLLTQARERSEQLEFAARDKAAEHEARAEAAAEQCRRVVEAMHTLENQVQAAVAAAMTNLDTETIAVPASEPDDHASPEEPATEFNTFEQAESPSVGEDLADHTD